MAEDEVFIEKSSALSLEARKSGNQLYGQKNHNKNAHKEILRLYAKSIAFATTGDELALGYGNRSALLLHLKEYDKCLIDVDRALKIANSAKLTSKLEIRKAICIDAMAKQTINGNSSSKKLPNFTPSASIPAASEAISAKYNEKFGRHVVATRDIKPGEVIVAERCYVCVPLINQRYIVCSHCLSFAWNGIPCESCAFAMYCNESCRDNALKEYHDVECGLFSSLTSELLESTDLMEAFRILIKAIKSEGVDAVVNEFDKAISGDGNNRVDGLMVDGQLRSNTFRSCINLSSRRVDNVSTHSDAIPLLAKVLSQAIEIDDREKIIEMLKTLTGIVHCNTYKYEVLLPSKRDDNGMKRSCAYAHRGNVLAPFGSFINHSCGYNVKRMFLPSGKLVMFTVAPIKKGEQLFTSYGPCTAMGKEERQRYFEKNFLFTCKCRACEEDCPHDPEQIRSLVNSRHKKTLEETEMDIKQSVPSAVSILTKSCGNWPVDEQTLGHAFKISELIYKHFDDDHMFASRLSGVYVDYVNKAFNALYGEKFAVPDDCP